MTQTSIFNIDIDRTVGLRVKEKRKGKGFTQEELARRIGVTRQNISNIEHGKVSISSADIVRFSIELETTPDELLLGKKENQIILNMFNECTGNEATIIIRTILFLKKLLEEYHIIAK